MTRLVSSFRDALGGLGLAALALFAAAAVFHFAVLKPLAARADAARIRVEQAAARPSSAVQPASTAGKVAAVHAFLQHDEQPTDWLAKLHAIGTATGVQLSSAAYKTAPSEGRIVRYEIALPLTGSYPQIRDFLERAAAEIPVMSIDQISLKRESRNDAALQAQLRVTFHMVKKS